MKLRTEILASGLISLLAQGCGGEMSGEIMTQSSGEAATVANVTVGPGMQYADLQSAAPSLKTGDVVDVYMMSD